MEVDLSKWPRRRSEPPDVDPEGWHRGEEERAEEARRKEAERRKRRRTALITGVATVAVFAVVAADRWRDRQFDVGHGPVGRAPELHVDPGFSSFDEEGFHFLPYRHGEEYEIMFSLSNDGRDVRVVDIPPPDAGLLEGREVLIERIQDRRSVPAPFKPFTLKTGDDVQVRIRVRFANCDRAVNGAFFYYPAQPVVVRALWQTRTIDIPFRTPIVVSTGLAGDPHPQAVPGPGCR